MEFFNASIGTIVMRYYFMMAIVIGSLLAGLPWLCLLAMPVLLSALSGITFNFNSKK